MRNNMDDTGVYNSTTVSYENPNSVSMSGGDSSPNRRPWNLSEIVSPPANRSRWNWVLLMGGSIVLGLGLIVVVIGIYNQHYYDPESKNVKPSADDPPQSHWIVTLIGCCLAVCGIIILVIYCRLMNPNGSTNRFLCNPLARTRTALRQVVTKPRYQPGRQGGTNLLGSDINGGNPILTNYNPGPTICHSNGEITSEEKANLMANEMKEGYRQSPQKKISAFSSLNERQKSETPVRSVPRQVSKSPSPPLPDPNHPPVRPPRHRYVSPLRRDAAQPFPTTSHYKPRHFASHGFGPEQLPPIRSQQALNKAGKAPLASLEDITPSLRSSFASVMMYPPSDWGNDSDEDADDDQSFDSTLMINCNLDERDLREREKEKFSSCSGDTALPIPDSEFVKFDDFRISPGRHKRNPSLSSLSVQSAL